jgi:hypothetical protein
VKKLCIFMKVEGTKGQGGSGHDHVLVGLGEIGVGESIAAEGGFRVGDEVSSRESHRIPHGLLDCDKSLEVHLRANREEVVDPFVREEIRWGEIREELLHISLYEWKERTSSLSLL